MLKTGVPTIPSCSIIISYFNLLILLTAAHILLPIDITIEKAVFIYYYS